MCGTQGRTSWGRTSWGCTTWIRAAATAALTSIVCGVGAVAQDARMVAAHEFDALARPAAANAAPAGLRIEVIEPLSFGRIVAPGQTEPVRLDVSGAVVTNAEVLDVGGQPGLLRITGAPDAIVEVDAVASMLTGAGSQPLAFDLFTDTPALLELDRTGVAFVRLGGAFVLPARAAAGLRSADLTVSVRYQGGF